MHAHIAAVIVLTIVGILLLAAAVWAAALLVGFFDAAALDGLDAAAVAHSAIEHKA